MEWRSWGLGSLRDSGSCSLVGLAAITLVKYQWLESKSGFVILLDDVQKMFDAVLAFGNLSAESRKVFWKSSRVAEVDQSSPETESQHIVPYSNL